MEKDFWLQAWREGRIGFHRDEVHSLLERHWAGLGVPDGASVLVPLCGKARDMVWLREAGQAVTGVELSRRALAQFVAENGLELEAVADGFEGSGYRLIQGDWFDAPVPGPHAAFYDRAALVAMPPARRPAYVEVLRSRLAGGARGLLITLEYDAGAMEGPPFSVTAGEVNALFGGWAVVEEVERTDILDEEPRFRERGLRRLQEVAWSIRVA